MGAVASLRGSRGAVFDNKLTTQNQLCFLSISCNQKQRHYSLTPHNTPHKTMAEGKDNGIAASEDVLELEHVIGPVLFPLPCMHRAVDHHCHDVKNISVATRAPLLCVGAPARCLPLHPRWPRPRARPNAWRQAPHRLYAAVRWWRQHCAPPFPNTPHHTIMES